jgi:hypothetical protein
MATGKDISQIDQQIIRRISTFFKVLCYNYGVFLLEHLPISYLLKIMDECAYGKRQPDQLFQIQNDELVPFIPNDNVLIQDLHLPGFDNAFLDGPESASAAIEAIKKNNSHLSAPDLEKFLAPIRRDPSAVVLKLNQIKECKLYEYEPTCLSDNIQPFYAKAFLQGVILDSIMKDRLDEMVSTGIIAPGSSPYVHKAFIGIQPRIPLEEIPLQYRFTKANRHNAVFNVSEFIAELEKY